MKPRFEVAITWPEAETILEKDFSIEVLRLELDKKRHQFDEALMNWITVAEARLAQMLPRNTQVPDFAGIPVPSATAVPKFALMTGAGDPINTLPVETQKLLRADVMFMPEKATSPRPYFYPHHFNSTYSPVEAFVYYEEAVQVAKALLNALEWPNASYLELKALGLAFCCGRCHTKHRYYHWEDIVSTVL